MRFKKLRFFVAVTLVVFLIMVGNIIAIGKFKPTDTTQNNLDNQLVAIESKKNLEQQIQTVNTNQNITPNKSETTTVKTQTTTTTVTAPITTTQNTGTVVHKTRKTRAS